MWLNSVSYSNESSTNAQRNPNQYGDYAGLASFGGVSRPIWTDSRRQLDPSAGCRTRVAMEEVFTATIARKR